VLADNSAKFGKFIIYKPLSHELLEVPYLTLEFIPNYRELDSSIINVLTGHTIKQRHTVLRPDVEFEGLSAVVM
jgi:hypothetical protein